MALTWVFNNASGSDTTSSGAGPGNGIVSGSALSGSSASFSGSVVTLDGSPDLSAFDANTWGLYLNTSTGRKFFDLTAANNGSKTVTCANAPAGTASGLTWGIGGKRKTLDDTNSRLLMTTDFKAGWDIYIEDDQTITSVINFNSSLGSNISRIYGPSGRVTITQSGNANHFGLGGASGHVPAFVFEKLKFVNSNGTKTSAIALNMGGIGLVHAKDCVFSDSTNKLLNGMSGGTTFSASCGLLAEDCIFDTCTGAGFILTSSNNNMFGRVINCSFRSCGASSNSGSIEVAGNNQVEVLDTDISKGSKSGVYIANLNYSMIKNCTIHANTGASSDGITVAVDNSSLSVRPVVIVNNNLTGNGRYGLNYPSSNYSAGEFIDYNNYGTGATANTSGARNNVTAGSNDQAVDPGYTDATNFDFSVGTAVKALGFPLGSRHMGSNPASGTNSYVDIGSSQRQETSSGSTAPIIKNKFNEGFN